MFIDESLYRKILTVMPVPCVDLLVVGPTGKVFLIKRGNEPARGSWWFPGGRVHLGESREQAAVRKLREECGFTALRSQELGTYDLILPLSTPGGQSHAISTLFSMHCAGCAAPVLDAQSDLGAWKTVREWLECHLHEFVRARLREFASASCPQA